MASEPSSTANMVSSDASKDAEIQALKESLARAQAAVAAASAQTNKVPSTTGDTDMQGNTEENADDPDLKELLLDWGDFDPETLRQLKQDPKLKQAFIAAHTLSPEVTQCMEGSHLAKRDSKRSRPSEEKLLLNTLDTSSISEDAMKQFFHQYHNSHILPPLEFLRNGFEQMYSRMDQQLASLHMALLSQQQQLATLEKQASRRMIILKMSDQPTLMDIKSNLGNLLHRAGVSEEMVQDKVNHYVPLQGFYIFITMVTESAKGMVLKALKAGFWWKTYGADSFKLKFEDHVTPTDRMLYQPFYAMLDLINATGLYPLDEIRTDKRYLQVFHAQADGSRQLLSQILYVPGSTGYRSMVLFHETLKDKIDSLPTCIQSRVVQARQLISAEKAAYDQGSTREIPSWHLQFDPVATGEHVYFPFEVVVQSFNEAMGTLLFEDPHLLLRGKPTLINVTANMAFKQRTPKQLESDHQPSGRMLPPHLQHGSDSTGFSKSKGKGDKNNRSFRTQYSEDSSKSKGKGKGKNPQWQSSHYTRDDSWKQWNDKQDRNDKDGPGSGSGSWMDTGNQAQGGNSGPQWGASSWTQPSHGSNAKGGHSKWQRNETEGNTYNPGNTATKGNTGSTTSIKILKVFLSLVWCSTCSVFTGSGNCAECSQATSIPCPLQSNHKLGSTTSCKYCADHNRWLSIISKGGTWFREESPFQIAIHHFIHKYIIEYGPFTVQGIPFCVEQINKASNPMDSSLLDAFSTSYLQMFMDILQTDGSAIYGMVPLQKFITPTMPQLNQNQDPNSNYSVKEVSVDYGHLCTRMCLLLFQEMIRSWQSLPQCPKMVSECVDDTFLTTSMLPYAKMIMYSFYKLTGKSNAKLTYQEIEPALKWTYHKLTLSSWGEAFSEWLRSNSKAHAIFTGMDPYNNANLKSLANVGSQMFDTMSVIFATAYQIGNAKRTNNEAAPNGTLVEMYDNLIKYQNISAESSSTLTRNWNNKGNSLETLAMTMLEDEQHPLLWFTAYVTLHASYQDSALPNIRQL